MRSLILVLCLGLIGCASSSTQQSMYSLMDSESPADTSAMSSMNTADCYFMGKDAAREHASIAGEAVGGFVLGVLGGVIGTAVAYFAVDEPRPGLDLTIDLKDDRCKRAFSAGYGETGESRKRKAAVTWGLTGTMVLLTVYLSSYSYY